MFRKLFGKNRTSSATVFWSPSGGIRKASDTNWTLDFQQASPEVIFAELRDRIRTLEYVSSPEAKSELAALQSLRSAVKKHFEEHGEPRVNTTINAQLGAGATPTAATSELGTETKGNPKKGCFGCLSIILLIGFAIGAWAAYEDYLGPVAMVHGEIYLVGDMAVHNQNGIGCQAADGYKLYGSDTPLTMNAGGSKDLHGYLSAGMATSPTECQFTFFGEIRDKGKYTITIGEGSSAEVVECPSILVVQSQGDNKPVLDVEIRVSRDGAACVRPRNAKQ